MDDNNEGKSIAERLLKPGFGLGPFAHRVTLKKKLAEERNSKKFIEEMSSQFCDLPNPMEDSTLQYLYDISLGR
jgi:hypothetical protein